MLRFLWSDDPDEAVVVFLAGQLRDMDARLRRNRSNVTVAELVAEIGPILDLIGIEMIDGELLAYARSVSDDTDWVFDLSSFRVGD